MGRQLGRTDSLDWVDCMWLELRRSQPGCESFGALTAAGDEADGTE